MVSSTDLHWKLLRCEPSDRNQTVQRPPICEHQGKAPFCRLQSRAGGVGGTRAAVDRRLLGGVSGVGGVPDEEDGSHR